MADSPPPTATRRWTHAIQRIGIGLLAMVMFTILVRFLGHLQALRLFCLLITPLFLVFGWIRPTLGFYPLLLLMPILPLAPHVQGELNFSLIEFGWWALLTGQFARLALQPATPRIAPPPSWPMLTLFTIAVVGSALVRLARNVLLTDPITWQVMWDSLGDFFRLPQESPLHPLRAAVVWLEGIALLRLVRQHATRRGFRMRVRFLLLISLAVVVSLALHQLWLGLRYGTGAPQILGAWQLETDWLPAWLREALPGLSAVHATWPDVNSFASYLLLMMPIALSAFVLARNVFGRALMMLLCAGTFLTLMATFSRIAWIWFPIGLGAWIVLSRTRSRRLWRWVENGGRWWLASALGLVLLGLWILAATDIGQAAVGRTVESRLGERLNVVLKGRIHLWEKSFRLAHEAPLFGVGQGAFFDRAVYHHRHDPGAPPGMRVMSDGEIVWNPEHENAHNQYLQVMAETGIVGLALLLLALGEWGRIALRFAAWGNGGQRYTARGSLAAVIALAGTLLTGHALLLVEMLFLFWTVVGLVFMRPRGPKLPDPPQLPPVWSGRAQVAAAALILITAGRLWNGREAPDLLHLGMGLYPPEDEVIFHPVTGEPIPGLRFQWTSNEVNLLLRNINGDCGFHLSNLHGEEDPVAVEVWIDGEQRAIISPPDAHWWPYRFAVPDVPPNGIYHLRLVVRDTFRPGGTDERTLGVRMRGLSY